MIRVVNGDQCSFLDLFIINHMELQIALKELICPGASSQVLSGGS